MNYNVSIAFYKGNKTIYDKLISFWTKSPLTHVELIKNGFWYSSSPRDGGVRKKKINYNKNEWILINLTITEEQSRLIDELFNYELNKKYDWLGIFLSQVFPLKIDDRNRWFCSEIVSYLLDETNIIDLKNIEYNELSPSDLYFILTDEIFKNT